MEIKRKIVSELEHEFSNWHEIKLLCDEAFFMEDNEVTYSRNRDGD